MTEPTRTPRHDAQTGRAVALVTGAARRVGRAVALEFARAGLDLALTYCEGSEECAETARIARIEAAQAGHAIEATVERIDFRAVDATERFASSLSSRGIGVFVHGASIYRETPLGSIDARAVEDMHRVEVLAPLLIAQSLRASLADAALAGGGAVVLFSDIHALGRPRAGFAGYLAAKGAVRALAEQLALELAPRVRVHCVAPGVVAWPPGFPEAQKEAILARTPLGRAGTVEECARLVRFLALEATYLTGQTIAIDGGRSIR